MTFLFFYWFITTMMALGVTFDRDNKFDLDSLFMSALSGWLVIPIKLGALISHLHKNEVSKENKNVDTNK